MQLKIRISITEKSDIITIIVKYIESFALDPSLANTIDGNSIKDKDIKAPSIKNNLFFFFIKNTSYYLMDALLEY